MGTRLPVPNNVADALFSPVQQRVLGLLFGQPRRRFQSAELIRLARGGTGAAHRILSRLAEARLVTVTRLGNQKYYQANGESSLFPELRGLAVKTFGLVDPIRRALDPLRDRIRAAFIYGAATGGDTTDGGIELLVIADRLRQPDVVQALAIAETTLGRIIDPTVMTLAQWRFRRLDPGSVTARAAASSRLFVLGSEPEIA
jgi:hypothetical protein